MTDFYIAITLSVTFSLLVEEFLGFNTGGMIVPGMLALHFFSIPTALAILIISFLVYFIVDYFLSKHLILFGKRKFSMMVLVSLLLKIVFDQLYPYVPFDLVAYRGIGAMTPALLANTYSRQGVRYTLPASLLTALVIFIILNAYHFI